MHGHGYDSGKIFHLKKLIKIASYRDNNLLKTYKIRV